MPVNRFFTSSALNEGAVCTLDDKESYHLRSVCRLQPGDTTELIDGKGGLAEAEVQKLGKKGAELLVLSVRRSAPSQERRQIRQAFIHASKLDWLLEKATELGATEICLFPAELSDLAYNEGRLERMQTVLISAIKQCGSLFLPTLKLIGPISSWQPEPHVYFGYIGSKAMLGPANYSLASFVNGPESGFSKAELQTMRVLGFKGVSLHRNVLRTETAPLAALAGFELLHTETA